MQSSRFFTASANFGCSRMISSRSPLRALPVLHSFPVMMLLRSFLFFVRSFVRSFVLFFFLSFFFQNSNLSCEPRKDADADAMQMQMQRHLQKAAVVTVLLVVAAFLS